jgi:hypothetical protein
MNSRLTIERPDLWQRGLDLATGLTGVLYLPKLPAADGTIFACGGGGPIIPTPPPTLEEQIAEEERLIEYWKGPTESDKWNTKFHKDKLEKLKQQKRAEQSSASVSVPDGAMEWLLHEVGHWIAASPEERKLPNYGDGHEVEAWAFEEIVLGQFGPARLFAPPTQRDGTAFDLSGPLPSWAFRHIDRRIAEDRVAVGQFQLLWAEWMRWGATLGHHAPWEAES